MKFSVYRFDPEVDKKPYMKKYEVDLDDGDQMLLDALMKIKQQDETLALRKSCREGVCGSDGMNINGKNGLACVTKLKDLKEPVVIRPMPGLPVIKDLIVDMDQFFKNYHDVKPYFINNEEAPNLLKIVKSLMDYMNVFCVVRVPPPAHLSGGDQINLWDLLHCCNPIDS